MTLGLLILLFVAYQLWGTGIFTARAQATLEDDFEAAQDAYAAVETTTTVPADDPTLAGRTRRRRPPLRAPSPPSYPRSSRASRPATS